MTSAGDDATSYGERVGEVRPFAQAVACRRQRLAERSRREGFARGDGALERYARGDERGNAAKHDRQVPTACRSALFFDCRRHRDREEPAARERRRCLAVILGLDRASDDRAVLACGAVGVCAHGRRALPSHDVTSASSPLPPG